MSDHYPLQALVDDPIHNTVHHPYSAHIQGWDAYEMGCGKHLNPYPLDTREADWWGMGWDDASDTDPSGDEVLALWLLACAQSRIGRKRAATP